MGFLRRRRKAEGPDEPEEVRAEKTKPEKTKREKTKREKTRRKKRRLRLAKDRQVEAFGAAFIAFGFLVTFLTWSGIRTATNVAYQLPVLASGGLVAIGCYIVGGLLLVGGIAMTRFSRMEKAGQLPETEAELRLFDEGAERRQSVSS
jgi:hypothetical protein